MGSDMGEPSKNSTDCTLSFTGLFYFVCYFKDMYKDKDFFRLMHSILFFDIPSPTRFMTVPLFRMRCNGKQ